MLTSHWQKRRLGLLLLFLRLTRKGWHLGLLKALHRIGDSIHATHRLLILILLVLIHPLHLIWIHAWLLHLALGHTSELVILLVLLHRIILLLLLWHIHHWVWHERFILLLLRSCSEATSWLRHLLLSLSAHLDTVKSSKLIVGRMSVCLIHLIKILDVYRLLISGHIICLLLNVLSAHSGLRRLEIGKSIILIICIGCSRENVVKNVLIFLLRGWSSIKIK